MPRRDYAIEMIRPDVSLGWTFALTVRRDFVNVNELKNAPGVARAMESGAGVQSQNETLQVFLVALDPLYESPAEAQAEFQKWLESRTVKLDGETWKGLGE